MPAPLPSPRQTGGFDPLRVLAAMGVGAALGGVLAAHTARAASELLIERARTRAQGEGDNVSLAVLKLVEAPSKKA